jgi:hypothetical protein
MRTRIRVAITVAALVAATALFIATPGAIGNNGDPVLAGQNNAATNVTTLTNTNSVSVADCRVLAGANDGLVGCGHAGVLGRGTSYGVFALGDLFGVYGKGGPYGVYGQGTSRGIWGSTTTGSGVYGENSGSTGIGVEGRTAGTGSAVYGHATANGAGVYGESETGTGTYGVGGPKGVYGSGIIYGVEGSAAPSGYGVYGHGYAGVRGDGTQYGVWGSADSGGTGVYGRNRGSTGIGVWGLTDGTGSAVYGEATANGVGVFGKSQTGAALRGDSPSGTALQVNGKAKFSRSGIATVAAGATSVNVSVPGMTASSMVIATAQQNGSVFVKAAVPAGGSFKLWLTGNAPAGGLKVAYFVLN